MDKKTKEIVTKALKLHEKNSQLKKLEKEVKVLREEILEEMTREDWKSIDLPGTMKLTLVEFIKEAVGSGGIDKIKTLLPERDAQTIVKTKEFVDKEGIKHLRALLSDVQLAEVIEQSPVRYVKITDRVKEEK
ncbi:MAG: hypothetical protein ACYTFW_12565 [Planctomycetota bacterium]|jgi:hypothetical protein